MKTWFVHSFLLSIEGNQSEGWHFSTSQFSRELLFNFEIEKSDNEGGFLLLCFSQDKEVYCDTWHKTLNEAFTVALTEYTILRELWKTEN